MHSQSSVVCLGPPHFPLHSVRSWFNTCMGGAGYSLTNQVCTMGSVCVKDVPTRCSSGKIHGPQSVMVNLNSFGQRLGVPPITLTRHMAALGTAEGRGTIMFWVFMVSIAAAINSLIQSKSKRAWEIRERVWVYFWPSPVMFFIHQMVTGTEGHQVGIIGWRRDGDWARTAHISVAQLVSEQLEFISSKTIVIPEHMVVRGTAGTLQEKDHIFTYSCKTWHHSTYHLSLYPLVSSRGSWSLCQVPLGKRSATLWTSHKVMATYSIVTTLQNHIHANSQFGVVNLPIQS